MAVASAELTQGRAGRSIADMALTMVMVLVTALVVVVGVFFYTGGKTLIVRS